MEACLLVNIGLIAMSGIRVCDSELLELGLTLPGFVERSKTIASLPSLGLLTLAGMTSKRHRCTYIEVPDIKAMDGVPDGLDLVAISSYSAQINEAYELGDRLKAQGTPVALGGPHVTALPLEAAEHCDAVVVGEGEASWARLLADCEYGRLAPLYGDAASSFDLTDSPMPAFDLLDITKYNRLTVQTSRGCPHRCEFCASSVMLTETYKQKPVQKVLAEIDRICELWPHPFLEFADDNSFVSPAYWKELLPQLKGKGLRWFAETDISVARDEELLQLMRRSGCVQVLVGLESPTETGLGGLEMRNDWKLKRLGDYEECIRTIQANGITVNGCFVLGLDGHTPDVFEQVFDFVKRTGLYEVQVTILTPFPGTPLYARLQSEQRLTEPDNWCKCTLFDLNFEPNPMSHAELENGFRGLVVKLYGKEFTDWRRRAFKRQLRSHTHEEGATP